MRHVCTFTHSQSGGKTVRTYRTLRSEPKACAHSRRTTIIVGIIVAARTLAGFAGARILIPSVNHTQYSTIITEKVVFCTSAGAFSISPLTIRPPPGLWPSGLALHPNSDAGDFLCANVAKQVPASKSRCRQVRILDLQTHCQVIESGEQTCADVCFRSRGLPLCACERGWSSEAIGIGLFRFGKVVYNTSAFVFVHLHSKFTHTMRNNIHRARI